MFFSRRILLSISVFSIVVCLDQLTKFLAKKYLYNSNGMELIPGILSLEFIKNTGIAFGLYKGMSLFLSLVGFIGFLSILVFFPEITRTRLSPIFLGLIFGGAISNFFDRLFLGWVVDFINIPFFSTFNFADVAITGGVLILIYEYLFGEGGLV
ncbi:MAG: signal peptidase II [Actinobacteria bacterium]|nr:signal peptidase II [Actinomycetota bacterium]